MRNVSASFSALLLFSALAGIVMPASAQTTTIGASSQGGYEGYYHDLSSDSYTTGTYYGEVFHSYFVFDLTNEKGPISYASFRAFNPVGGFLGGNTPYTTATDIFNLYAVSDTVSAVETSNTYFPNLAIFADLVGGNVLGSVAVSSASDNGNVNVVFNSAGLSYLMAHEGQQVVLGGGMSGTNGVFFNSNPAGHFGTNITQLTVVPEPSSIALLAGIVVTYAGFFKSRRRRA